MFRFFIYSIILFITGVIAIYALSNSDSSISIETLNFSIQTNVPLFFVIMLGLMFIFSFILFGLYWLASLPRRLKKSQKKYIYQKSVKEIFDLFCDLDTETGYKNRMNKFNFQDTQAVINHPVVELLDYKLSAYVQNKEKHARALARIKNNKVVGGLFYKEMILSKIHADEYEDARGLLLEFMNNNVIYPLWFYKTAIFVFSCLGDIVRGKDLIEKAKKIGAIEDYALEMSNLYLNKARLLEKAGGDKSEILKYSLKGLEYDDTNLEIIESLGMNISSLMGDKKVVETLKTSWIDKAYYKTIEILFYIEPFKDESDLKEKIEKLLKKNNSDEAKLSLARFVAAKGFYKFSVEILEKIRNKEQSQEYERINAFLQIVYLSDSSKAKLEILKKQML